MFRIFKLMETKYLAAEADLSSDKDTGVFADQSAEGEEALQSSACLPHL